MGKPVTLIFDIGKTNKKLFLFDEDLSEIKHEYIRFEEIPDEDGFLSEDLPSLVKWIKDSADRVFNNPDYEVKAVNFSTYGASMVHLDEKGELVTPFINYLKPFPEELLNDFFSKYGPEEMFSVSTASPSMGMLNSGLQLYFLKYKRPNAFKRLHKSLHFPQYLSYLFTGNLSTDFTSLGCHTGLWDFGQNKYADWLEKEDLVRYLTPLEESTKTTHVDINGNSVNVGIGVHDSSSALVPYIQANDDPFVLISTGTWSICMNIFNDKVLTAEELKADCLNFLSAKGISIKASRLFLGKHLSNQAKLLSEFFDIDYQTYKTVAWKKDFKTKKKTDKELLFDHSVLHPERFGFVNNPKQDLSIFESYEDAYFHLMDELTDLQIASLKLAIGDTDIKRIFIDGGFSSNEVFVKMLADKLPTYKIYSTSFALGTALGAALLVNYRTITKEFLSKNYNVKKHSPSS
ncbi:FGGY family carbohydrate kinase [Imperialibacter roseus]|uniref:FGGY family carbohydrate kinase n=1 Tax=Imperialibacter roseus TaxID=1324217 RepID=A0ABZ0ISU6_9BACT|nr:FGGY family carbohydrate kinase [Imperialibacter roseus]WOK07030.1 FGGY family carbohydrate kinase [Imperialibacter roseus]